MKRSRPISLLSIFTSCVLAQDVNSPTLRVDTRLVLVAVIATNRENQPVLDLRKEDFVLKDNGVEQKIAGVSFGPEQGNKPALAAPPGERVFYNRPAFPAGNLTVVLLDDLNTEPQDQASARKQVVSSLSSPPAKHPVALYVLGAGLTLVRDFVNGGRAASQPPRISGAPSLGNKVVYSNSTPAETSNRKLDEALNSASNKISDYQAANRAETTLKAFQEIAQRMKAVPGRKSLIWVSGGFPFSIGLDGAVDLRRDRRSFSGETERAARILDDAQVAVYPVDARGARAPDNAPIDRHVSSRTIARSGRGDSSRDLDYDEMVYLADLTGGRASHSSNDLSKSILSAIEDGAGTYSLDFYPDVAWDGKFHRLDLAVNRPGVKLRYRMGYFASKSDSPPASPSLEEAIKQTQDLKAIGLSVGVGAQDGAYKLTVAIDPRDLKLTKTEENWVGALELKVISCPAGDCTQNGQAKVINIRLPQGQYIDALGQGLRFTTSVHVPVGFSQIRIGVRDQNSGAIGTLFLTIR